jgi:hypothetical protein
LQQEVEGFQEELRHLDAENEQLKDECREGERTRARQAALLAHTAAQLAREQSRAASALTLAQTAVRELGVVMEHVRMVQEEEVELQGLMRAAKADLEQTQVTKKPRALSHQPKAEPYALSPST